MLEAAAMAVLPPPVMGVLERVLTAPSPFYRRRFRDAGIDAPGPDAALLRRLPLTRRAELVRDQLAHLPFGTRRCADAGLPVRVGITGSGPELLVLAWTAADLARERAAGARLLGRLGVRPGMRVANTLGGALTTPGALLLGDVVEEIGALDVPLGALDTEAAARQAWELIDRVEPEVLIVDRASRRHLFAAAPARSRPWWRVLISLRVADEEAEPPAPVPELAGFDGWLSTWVAAPEATSFAAHSCAAGRFHADPGVLAEVVDEAGGGEVPAGETGTLALTPLGGDTPVLRYLSGPRARGAPGACPCGAGGLALELDASRQKGS